MQCRNALAYFGISGDFMANKQIRSVILGAAIFSASLFSGISGAAPREINVGFISSESSQSLRARWEPFLKDMEKDTGFRINAFFASDYAGMIMGMQYGKVQVALYGNESAMEAVDRAEGEVFAQVVDAAGNGGYYSHLIVHKDSPLNSEKDMLAQAGNLSFGNGDPNSTSGFLVPGYYVFAQNHVDPKSIFKRILNASHETNAFSIANKQIDVATCSSVTLEHLGERQPEKRAQIKIIWTSPLIPSSPFVWRKDLPDDVKGKIMNFFLNYGQKGRPEFEHEKTVLEALQYTKFRASNNDQLLPIRQLNLFKERSSIERDGHISSAEKQARLNGIDDKLAALNARVEELNRTKRQ